MSVHLQDEVDFEISALYDDLDERRFTIPPWLVGPRARRLGAMGWWALSLALMLALPGSIRLFPTPLPVAHELRLVTRGLDCIVDAAWSPTGTRLALAGYAQDCGAIVFTTHSGLPPLKVPGSIVIVDPQTGRQQATLHPDDAVLAALGATPDQHWLIFYSTLLWSHDERSFALNFQASRRTSEGTIITHYGIALVPITDSGARAMITDASGLVVWDLQTGKPITTASDAGILLFSLTMSPASSYHWSRSTLAPGGSLAPAPHPVPITGAIGDPATGAPFGPWQPGTLIIFRPFTLWYTVFASWSPDGRYLATNISLGGQIDLPGHPIPTATDGAKLGLRDAPVLPLRDAGLGQAFAFLEDHAITQSLAVVYSPDGTRLAIYDSALTNLTILESATGQTLLTLTPPPSRDVVSGTDKILRWSPDGRWLFLGGTQLGTAYLWYIGN